MSRLKIFRARLDGLAVAKGRRKQPVDFGLATKIVDEVPPHAHDKLVFETLLLTGICGLMRLGELLPASRSEVRPERLLRVGHIQFYPNIFEAKYMTLYIPYSKTDKYGCGETLVIPACNDVKYCPVQHMSTLVMGRAIQEPIFVWPTGTLVTKGAFIRLLRKYLKALGIDYTKYSGHSLRRGGAISAKAAGASNELIKILGRWNSEAYKVYLRQVPGHIQQLNSLLESLITSVI